MVPDRQIPRRVHHHLGHCNAVHCSRSDFLAIGRVAFPPWNIRGILSTMHLHDSRQPVQTTRPCFLLQCHNNVPRTRWYAR